MACMAKERKSRAGIGGVSGRSQQGIREGKKLLGTPSDFFSQAYPPLLNTTDTGCERDSAGQCLLL